MDIYVLLVTPLDGIGQLSPHVLSLFDHLVGNAFNCFGMTEKCIAHFFDAERPKFDSVGKTVQSIDDARV